MTYISFEYILFFYFLKRVFSHILSIFSAILTLSHHISVKNLNFEKRKVVPSQSWSVVSNKILLYWNSICHFSNFANPWPTVHCLDVRTCRHLFQEPDNYFLTMRFT